MGAFPWLLLTCALCVVYEGACVAEGQENDARNVQDETSHARFEVFEGRGKKKKAAMQMKMMMTVKMIVLGILIPKLIGIALFASWKGITISLISLAIALMAVLRSQSSQSGGHGEKSIHVLVKKEDGKQHHEHWWRRIRDVEPAYNENDHDHHKGPYSGWEMEYQ